MRPASTKPHNAQTLRTVIAIFEASITTYANDAIAYLAQEKFANTTKMPIAADDKLATFAQL